jgi:hypothetical protein
MIWTMVERHAGLHSELSPQWLDWSRQFPRLRRNRAQRGNIGWLGDNHDSSHHTTRPESSTVRISSIPYPQASKPPNPTL